ncbi:MAG: hypothetical protein ACI9OJ_005716, partial [Myxococcota bacterium]
VAWTTEFAQAAPEPRKHPKFDELRSPPAPS